MAIPQIFTFSDEAQQPSNQKININQTHLTVHRTMDLESNSEPITLAYYPFRAKGQVCRLLCEYLRLPYHDRFFDPDEWAKFKEIQAKDWIIRDLPFLQDGDFFITGPLAIITYIVEKANRPQLFGRTIEQKALVDSIRSKTDLCIAMIGAKCASRPTCEMESKKCMGYYWQNKIKPILLIYEKECKLDPWFLSEITIIDFFVYEAVNLLEKIFPNQISSLNKLTAIRERVGKIPQIQEYQKSERAVRDFCPLQYFNKFKESKLKSSRSSSSANSTSSCSSKRKMDLQ